MFNGAAQLCYGAGEGGKTPVKRILTVVKDAQESHLREKCTSGPLEEALSDAGRWLWMRKWKNIGTITHRRQEGL